MILVWRSLEIVVCYFNKLFSKSTTLSQDLPLIEGCIPHLLNDEINIMLTICPRILEIKAFVFILNKDGAFGFDRFEALFQHYWMIIQQDVIVIVLQFFQTSWIMPNYNANAIVLLPKDNIVDSIHIFRPIALANFKFKILFKILANKLAYIMHFIISKE